MKVVPTTRITHSASRSKGEHSGAARHVPRRSSSAFVVGGVEQGTPPATLALHRLQMSASMSIKVQWTVGKHQLVGNDWWSGGRAIPLHRLGSLVIQTSELMVDHHTISMRLTAPPQLFGGRSPDNKIKVNLILCCCSCRSLRTLVADSVCDACVFGFMVFLVDLLMIMCSSSHSANVL